MANIATTWTVIHIEDATGKKGFVTHACENSRQREMRFMLDRLDRIKEKHPSYVACGFDSETANIIIDGVPMMTIDQIFEELEKELNNE